VPIIGIYDKGEYKKMKKISVLALTICLSLSMSLPGFALEPKGGSIGTYSTIGDGGNSNMTVCECGFRSNDPWAIAWHWGTAMPWGHRML